MNTNDIHACNIIVLGPSGSGKTVFLASMYEKLAKQSTEIPFFIQTSPEQHNKLRKKYLEVSNAGSWPGGTAYDEISEWNFTCLVRPPLGSNQEVLRFSYLDYAGGRITDIQEDDDESDQFERRLMDANALLGILDGRKLLAFMEDDPLGLRFVFIELPNMLNIMDRSNQTIHFIITKWDIISRFYTLEAIRNRLFQIDEFCNVISSRKKSGSPIRLIPVSSVGMDFARLLPDGSMLKIPGRLPHPYQVEVPFCCVLPDHITAEINKLKAQEQKLQQFQTPAAPRLTRWQRLKERLGGVLRYIGNSLDINSFNELADFAESSARNTREDFRREKERLRTKQSESLLRVRDRQSALQHAINSFLYITSKLDAEFPESNLSRYQVERP